MSWQGRSSLGCSSIFLGMEAIFLGELISHHMLPASTGLGFLRIFRRFGIRRRLAGRSFSSTGLPPLTGIGAMSQDKAQGAVRALFTLIESSASAKALSGKLFQYEVIGYDCLQKIRRADCDTDANAVLAEHLYQSSTEKTLQEFYTILKESGLPKQKKLGEQIEAALTAADTAVALTVSSDESAQARAPSPRPSAESGSDHGQQERGVEILHGQPMAKMWPAAVSCVCYVHLSIQIALILWTLL